MSRTIPLMAAACLSMAGAAAQPVVSSVVHAATQVPRGMTLYRFAPNTLVRIAGTKLGPATAVSRSFLETLPLSLGGTSVEVQVGVQRFAAPILSAQDSTVFAMIPNDVALGMGTLTVTANGQTSAPSRDFPIVERAPGLFSLNGRGFGPAVAFDPNLRPITVFNPLNPGERFMLIGTGFGRAISLAASPLKAWKTALQRMAGESGAEPRFAPREEVLDVGGSSLLTNLIETGNAALLVTPAPPSGNFFPATPVTCINQMVSADGLQGVKLPFAITGKDVCASSLTGVKEDELRDLRDKPQIDKLEVFRDATASSLAISARVTRMPKDVFEMIDPPAFGTFLTSFPGTTAPPDPVFGGRQIPYGDGKARGPGGQVALPFLPASNRYQGELNPSFNAPGVWEIEFNNTGVAGANRVLRLFNNVPAPSLFDIPSTTTVNGRTEFSVPVPPSSHPNAYWSMTMRVFSGVRAATGILTGYFPGNSNVLSFTPEELSGLPFTCSATANIEVALHTPVSNQSWVFAADSTDVTYDVRVADTQTGSVLRYYNPQGNNFLPVTDVRAFATCL